MEAEKLISDLRKLFDAEFHLALERGGDGLISAFLNRNGGGLGISTTYDITEALISLCDLHRHEWEEKLKPEEGK